MTCTLPASYSNLDYIPESFLLPSILAAVETHHIASLRVLLEYRAQDPDRSDESLEDVLDCLARDLNGGEVASDILVSLLHHAISPAESLVWSKFLFDCASFGQVAMIRLLLQDDARILGSINRVHDEPRPGRFGTALYGAMRMAAGVWESRRGILSVSEFVKSKGKERGAQQRYDVWYKGKIEAAVEIVGLLVGAGADVGVCERLWEVDERLDAPDEKDRERVREVIIRMTEVVEEVDGEEGAERRKMEFLWKRRENEEAARRKEKEKRELRRSRGDVRDYRRSHGDVRELRKSQSENLGTIKEVRWGERAF